MSKRNRASRLLLTVVLIGCSFNLWIDSTGAAVVSAAAGTSTPAKRDAFVAFPESQCHIPFWHKGVWHHTCIKYNDLGDFWCSLSSNFTRDENWRRCRSPDLKRFQCHVPFEFEGRNHTKCLLLEPSSSHGRGAQHSFWCAVVPKLDTWRPASADWAYCEHPSATGIAYLKEVGIKKSLQDISAETADAAKAVALNAPSKSLSGSGGSGATPGLSSQAIVGISVGVVFCVLAVAAVIVMRKRPNSCGNHKALLQTREKGTYGGTEASE